MKIQTIHKEGEAIQYTGDNIEEIAAKFNLEYEELRSHHSFKGKDAPDIRLGDAWQSEDLLVGDLVFKSSESNDWEVIPLYDFSNWEVID